MAVQERMINGVDVQGLNDAAQSLKDEPNLGKFKFQVRNTWLDCGHNQTTIDEFHGLQQDIAHEEPFLLDADEPPILLGKDLGPNPVEYLLTSLVSCITSSMVYHASARGIHIEKVESEAEGDLDIRGFMGLAKDVRKGYQNIRVKFRVKSDASPEKLEECARFSPVLDVVSSGTNVSLEIEKI